MEKLDPKSKIGGIAIEMKVESNIDDELAKMDIMIEKAKTLNELLVANHNEINAISESITKTVKYMDGTDDEAAFKQ